MATDSKNYKKNNETVKCLFCRRLFDLDDCETDKYWKEDRVGVSHHIVVYQCPHCGTWNDEDEIKKYNK